MTSLLSFFLQRDNAFVDGGIEGIGGTVDRGRWILNGVVFENVVLSSTDQSCLHAAFPGCRILAPESLGRVSSTSDNVGVPDGMLNDETVYRDVTTYR